MVAITPKTELRAVNLILQNMGETPVNTLTGSIPLEASQARDVLREISEDVQARGWYFNREVHSLPANEDGEVLLPSNTLGVRTVGNSRNIQVVQRGARLYNKTPFENTFEFSGSVDVELVLGLPFDELPDSARLYIAIKAARVYQAREQGDDMALQEDSADEQAALAALHAEQLAAEPVSMRESLHVWGIASNTPYGLLY